MFTPPRVAGDDDRGLRFAIKHDGEIKFAERMSLDWRDQDFADELAGLAGLRGDEGLADHLAGEFLDLFRGFDKA